MNLSKIRESARIALTGKWGKGACITLAYLAFNFIVGFVIGLFGEDSVIGSLLDLANSIISVPLTFGLVYAFIKLKRNEDVKAFDFLNLGFSNFGRAWKIGLRTVLKMILPLIGCIVLFIVAAGILVYTGATGEYSIGPTVAAVIVMVVSYIWLLTVNLLYSLTAYIAYDNPEMSSLDVVNESARMMKGNRAKIFLLSLSFIGWVILSAITLGIGYLWLLPYMMVAEVCFYEHLLGKNETENNENNAEVITEM